MQNGDRVWLKPEVTSDMLLSDGYGKEAEHMHGMLLRGECVVSGKQYGGGRVFVHVATPVILFSHGTGPWPVRREYIETDPFALAIRRYEHEKMA